MMMMPRTTPGIRNGSHAAVDHLRFARSRADATASVAPASEVISEAPNADFPAANAGIICFQAFALEARWLNGKATEVAIRPIEMMAAIVRQDVPKNSLKRSL